MARSLKLLRAHQVYRLEPPRRAAPAPLRRLARRTRALVQAVEGVARGAGHGPGAA